MAIYKEDVVDIELSTGNIHRSFLNHAIGTQDNNADHFGIRVYRDGQPVDLTGVSVQGIFMPPEGNPIAITSGNIVNENKAIVVLPQACYNYDGKFTLAIKLVGEGVTGTIRIVDGVVDNTHATGTVAPTETVPTYQEILAQYEQMQEATEEAIEAAELAENAINGFVGISETGAIVYNYDTKEITFPASGFVMYHGRPYAKAEGQTIDLTELLVNEACTLWLNNSKVIYAQTWSEEPEAADDEFLGYVFGKHVYINGFSNNRIKVIDSDGNIIGTYDTTTGSFIGIEAEVRKVKYDYVSKTLTLPGGFKVYRGDTSAYSQEIISLSAMANGAAKLWMKNDKTVYATSWSNNAKENLNDDCIGFIYGTVVKINGIPDYCVSIVDETSRERTGLYFGDAYIGINDSQEIVYDYTNHELKIPAGFNVYRGLGFTRSAVTLDVSGMTNEACILYMKNFNANHEIYAKSWSSNLLEMPDDQIVGIIWGKNVFINGVNKNQISVLDANSKVLCFGDSITAGTNTTKVYHMYFHDYEENMIFYNYGVGSTGYVYETSDTVTVGGGTVGVGSAHKENGNNSIKKIMQSVSGSMPNIIIAAGTNDYGMGIAINTFRAAVQDALDYALTKTQRVVVFTPIKRNRWETDTNSQGLHLKDYADVIKEECDNRGIAWCDGFDVALNPTLENVRTAFMPDGLHPNASGQARMARNYYNRMMEAMCR